VERAIDRAIKSLNLVLQSGVCSMVVLDMVDVPSAGLRRVPATTWLRLQRIVEGTDIACLLMGPLPLARSAGGVAVSLGPRALALWHGDHDRARRLAGVSVQARLTSPRWTREGRVAMATTTRAVGDTW
jgi:hypothetical protein